MPVKGDIVDICICIYRSLERGYIEFRISPNETYEGGYTGGLGLRVCYLKHKGTLKGGYRGSIGIYRV